MKNKINKEFEQALLAWRNAGKQSSTENISIKDENTISSNKLKSK